MHGYLSHIDRQNRNKRKLKSHNALCPILSFLLTLFIQLICTHMVRKLGKNKAKGPLEHESDFIPLNARGPTSTRGSRQRGGRGRGSSNGQGRAHKPRRSHHSAPVQGHGPGLVTQIISSLQNQPSKGQGRTIQIKSHRGRRVRVSAYQRRPTGHRDDLENASIYLRRYLTS